MKRIFAMISLAFLFGIQACETEKNVAAIYLSDCSGDYLQVDGKEYLVCNYERFIDVPSGMHVTVFFSFVEDCEIRKVNIAPCDILHTSYAWVEIRNMYQ